MPSSRRAVCAGLPSALLALPLAGCGGGDPIPDDQPPATDPPAEAPLPGDEDATEQLEGDAEESSSAGSPVSA